MTNVKRGDKILIRVADTEFSVIVSSIETVTVEIDGIAEEWYRVRARCGVQCTVPYFEKGDNE